MISQDNESTSLLLSGGQIDIHMQDDNNRTPFWYAAGCGNMDAAQLLIMHGANPNTTDSHRITPLHSAIWGRDRGMVGLLLDHNDLDISSYIGETEHSQPLLTTAVCAGDTEILKMLLCRGATLNIYNYHGYHPPQQAVERKDLSMAKLPLSHEDIKINLKGQSRYRFTALHQAAYDGCLPILNTLLGQADVNVNAKDAEGRTPLWWAIKNGHPSVVSRLLAESDLEFDGNIEGQPSFMSLNRGPNACNGGERA